MLILVINSGSSTLKFQLIDVQALPPAPGEPGPDHSAERRISKGTIERIGGPALLHFEMEGSASYRETVSIRDHREALDKILRWLGQQSVAGFNSLSDLAAVGHRVVHGGERFKDSVLINDAVVRGIEDCAALAPLHNPANLRGIKAIESLFGGKMPQVAVFDTAFHSTMPEAAYLYGLPYSLYIRHKIRRYGFHGTSHRYVADSYRILNDIPRDQVNIVSLHLGNGCSACAIRGGQSIDTSMGMTPLEGLLMGTRSGDLDPSIVEFLIQTEGLSPSEVDSLLNKQSGLLGISGLTGDMRDLLAERAENKDRRASLAIDIFCRRVQYYVGAYLAILEGARAIVFTGGIGQRAWEIREQVCRSLKSLGLILDDEANACAKGNVPAKLSKADSPLEVWVIPTDEELVIARDTVSCINARAGRQ